MNKNLIIFGLGILAILTLGVITMPHEASADRAGRVTAYNSTDFADVRTTDDEYNTYQGGSTSNTVSKPKTSTAINPTVTKTSTVKKTTTATSNSTDTNTGVETDENANSIGANALFGTNGFTPSGLIQWILLAILILIIVILVRKVTGAEKRYHAEPLKHA